MASEHVTSRIVVLAPNWLGDVVMALPALADVRRQFCRATLAVAARQGLAPLFESVPCVDAIVPLAPRSNLIKRWRGDSEALASGRFDVAILFPNSFYSTWIVKQAGVPERWGYRADLRGALLTRSVRRPRGTIHRAEYYQTLVRVLGITSGPLRPHIVVAERDRSGAGKFL
jgi:lipopolysaccharide heptosyltransferase II